jgi:YggT family protein
MTPEVLQVFRYAVLAVAGTLALAGMAAMAVQRRAISPFSRAARTIRTLTDPLLKPVERRLHRSGGNPTSAPMWLIGIGLVGGIVLISFVQWLAVQIVAVRRASRFGGQTLVYTLVNWGFNLLALALLIRVIGSWFGLGRYSKFMRPFVFLTEWMLAPLRRILPPFGPLDVSPLVAWLLLQWLLRPLVLGLL